MKRDVWRAVIVDDEPLAREVIHEYLATHADMAIIAECANGFEAVRILVEQKPDLVFLDIQMPKLNGFEVLEVADWDGAVIFVTAYDQHAIHAFDVHAVDYLLKPFSRERFEDALAAVRRRRPPETGKIADIHTAMRPPGQTPDRLLVRDGTQVHVIPVQRIDYVEAQDDYVCIHVDGKKHLKLQRLARLEAWFDASRFVRIHRSFILNIDRLARIELYAKDSRMAILKDGTKLPVSRRGYVLLKRFLE